MSTTTTAVKAPCLYIGDEVLTQASAGTYQHTHPVTGEPLVTVPLAGKEEVDRAVACAKKAFQTWRFWRPDQRRDALYRLALLIKEHADEFAQLAALDGGTPVAAGRAGAITSHDWTAYYAGWADKLDGQVTSTYCKQGEFSYTMAEPLGVVGIIITWNGPLISLGMKVGPALAAGNTVVCKPAEFTPLAADLFARLVLQAGIPPGVFNLVTGTPEAGEALVRHPDVKKISFTGGPIAARRILSACSEQLKPALLELGGKSANLLFPDADLDTACMLSVMWSIGVFSGQGCALPTRLLVHESIYSQVLERVTAIAKGLKVGDPFQEDTIVGPLINRAACDRVMGMLERARDSKAGRFLCGGGRWGEGNYIEPAVIADLDPNSEIGQHEVFGPVLGVMKFSSEEEAIALANDTAYGLAAFIQSNNLKRVHRVAEQLHAGAVYVNGATPVKPNTPFGGLGLSGYGKEGGRQGIDEYLQFKTVAIA